MVKRAVMVLLAAACVEPPPPDAIPEGDLESFAATVQPVLDARCADPTCHGRPERPLRTYSPGRFRADPARTFLDEPLDDAELAANARMVAAFAVDSADVDDCLVLRKPLALAAGGCGHGGGEIFASRDDRELRALRAWLLGVMP
jgi:hypothetical protein